jgi:hypothetical protein
MHKSFLTIAAIGSISCLLSQAGPLDRIKDRRAARCANCTTTTTEVVTETKQQAEIITKERFKLTAKPVGKTIEIVPVPAKSK